MNQPARDIQKAELPNGVVIVTEKMPHVRSVSVGIWLSTGSRAETSGRNGIAHFIEQTYGGTDRAVDGLGRRNARRLHGQGNDLLQCQGARRASSRSPRRALGS